MPEFKLSPAQTIYSDGAFYLAHEAAKAALECLVWSAPDELDKKADISKELTYSVIMDVADFLSIPEVCAIVRKLNLSGAEVGHNLYLSAHGEGEGFWSRSWGTEDDRMTLHEKAQSFPRYLYVRNGEIVSE